MKTDRTNFKAAIMAALICLALMSGCAPRPGSEAGADASSFDPDAAADTDAGAGEAGADAVADTSDTGPGEAGADAVADTSDAGPDEAGADAGSDTSDAGPGEAGADAGAADASNAAKAIPFENGSRILYNATEYRVSEVSGGYRLTNPATGRLLSLDLEEPVASSKSVERLLDEIEAVYRIAHDTPYTYGDSQTDVPCEDNVISCDRLIARALWNIGTLDDHYFRDQQPHGMTIFTEDAYLTSHGFHRIDDMTALQRGDIILYNDTANGEVHHTCILTAYNSATGLCARFDAGITGSTPKFYRDEPIVEPVLYNYDYVKEIRHVYRLDSAADTAENSALIFKEKETADPAELSQQWVLLTADGQTATLVPAVYECVSGEAGNSLKASLPRLTVELVS